VTCQYIQQDGAPAHQARETVDLLKCETPDFISLSLWPPNSPDLNPVDYAVWGIIQDRVYKTKVKDVEELRQCIMYEWEHLDQHIIETAIRDYELVLPLKEDSLSMHCDILSILTVKLLFSFMTVAFKTLRG